VSDLDLLTQWSSWCSWHGTYGAEPEWTGLLNIDDAMANDPEACRIAFLDSWYSARQFRAVKTSNGGPKDERLG
jgi:hypothetical protein